MKNFLNPDASLFNKSFLFHGYQDKLSIFFIYLLTFQNHHLFCIPENGDGTSTWDTFN